MYRNSDGSKFPRVHPDRLALVAILNLAPLSGKNLHICWPISQRLIEACKVISRISLTSEEGHQDPIDRASSGRISLAFSGGADSIAALGVMPHSTEPVFMLRSKSQSRSLYDSDAAIKSCNKLTTLGYKVHIIESDFEYIRNPVGFPTDLSVATPAILLAESRNFESIAFGTILESAYGTSGKNFRDYLESSHFRLWNQLFESVGIGYSLPVSGVSEVGSSILCRKIAIGDIHQSCIRGKWKSPCDNCWKCFRKNTLMAALESRDFPEKSMEMIFKSKEVRKRLLEDSPIKHEGVLTYSLERVKGGGEPIEKLRNLTRVGKIRTDWMERWYPDSKFFIDKSYREYTASKLIKLLGEMSASQISCLQSWENTDNKERSLRLSRFRDSIDG